MKRIKVLKAYFVTWLFVLYIVYANAELLGTFFMATVIFSSAILSLLAVGTLYQIISGYGIVMLGGTFGALAYKKTGYEFYLRSIDSILPANIAHMLQNRKSQQQMLFTQEESRNIIDWLEGKFQKQKVYINFFINTAMLIGLLGTFVGLVEAIDHMGQIILGLNDNVDIKQVMQDFSGPISGMAIGFGASLFGVVAAVILGINGYILFRYQDTLISGIEDWLKDRIIDTVPENMGGSSAGTTNLPDQRKSFMDIFIEQMDSFTNEIAKLSKSGDNTQLMADSLISIKNILENDRGSATATLQKQEEASARVEILLSRLLESQEGALRRSVDDRVVLQNTFENHGKLLEQSVHSLVSLNKNMESVDKKIENEYKSIESLVSQNENSRADKERMRAEFVGALQQVDSSVNKETQAITTFAAAQEGLGQKLVSAMQSISSAMSEIDKKMSKDSNLLSEISRGQKSGITELESLKEELSKALSLVESSIKSQTGTMKELAKSQEQEAGKQDKNQEKIIGLLGDINRLNDSFKTFDSISSGLSSIEELALKYSQEQKEAQAAVLKDRDEKHKTVILELGSKIDSAETQIKAMNNSIKNIENMLSGLAKDGIVGMQHGGTTKQSLFSKLFSKKITE